MKVVLVFHDMSPEAEACLLEWLRERIADKSPENTSPLRYVESMEVVGEGEDRNK